MIANGILFKADFDMSKYTKQEILRQYNPVKIDATNEDIQATSKAQVTKIVSTGDNFKFVGYKSEDEYVLNQVLESSLYMQEVAPRLLKVIEISSHYFIVSYPYYPTSCDLNYLDWKDEISEEDEDRFELSNKIEDTIKELARVAMFLSHEHSDPSIIKEKLDKYVSLCFKFLEPEIEEEELLTMEDIEKDLEEKLKNLCLEENKKKDKGEDNNSKD